MQAQGRPARHGALELLPAGLPGPAAGGFTTRTGGVSAGPWSTAHVARHVGDDPEHVSANRQLLAREVGLAPERLVFAEQVHGRGVALVDDGAAGQAPVAAVDALVTAVPGLALVMMAADCLPVLLAEPVAGVVAAVHAGRQGLAAGVLQEALRVMAEQGAQPGRTSAVLGPAVCGRCYELPTEVADEVEAAVPGSRSRTRQGTAGVDLTAGAEAVLARAGVGQVRRVGGCTLEQPEAFYSYRGSGTTGRHAGLVWLRA